MMMTTTAIHWHSDAESLTYRNVLLYLFLEICFFTSVCWSKHWELAVKQWLLVACVLCSLMSPAQQLQCVHIFSVVFVLLHCEWYWLPVNTQLTPTSHFYEFLPSLHAKRELLILLLTETFRDHKNGREYLKHLRKHVELGMPALFTASFININFL